MAVEVEILKDIIGDNLFEEVMKKLGGGYLYIPHTRLDKYKSIYKDFEANIPLKVIARKHGFSYPWIVKICKKRGGKKWEKLWEKTTD